VALGCESRGYGRGRAWSARPSAPYSFPFKIFLVGIERARDSQPARLIAAVPPSADDLEVVYAPNLPARDIVLGSYTGSSAFPRSAGD
jgi:hypothetical protein